MTLTLTEPQPTGATVAPPPEFPFALAGLGTAVPETAIDQATSARLAAGLRNLTPRQARRELLLYRQAGVTRRHLTVLREATPAQPGGFFTAETGVAGPTTAARMARYASDAPPLAESACRKALAAAQIAPAQITHLVIVSCTGFAAPGVDIALIQSLGLPPTVERVQVGFMGCHGAINGLRTAEGLARSRPGACVLLCAVELCSLHFQFGTTADELVANSLFSDGAAAVVGYSHADPSASPEPSRRPAPFAVFRGTGSCLLPDSNHAMQWRIGNHGFAMTLDAEVPALIGKHLRGWLSTWLAAHGESIDTIAAWAIHPGGPRILDSARDALNLPEARIDPSRQVLADYGNMSSPTVLFILERLRAAGATGPCVLLGFGPGLTAEVALLNLAG